MKEKVRNRRYSELHSGKPGPEHNTKILPPENPNPQYPGKARERLVAARVLQRRPSSGSRIAQGREGASVA